MDHEARKDLAMNALGHTLETSVRSHIELMEQGGYTPDECLSILITCLSSGLVSFAQLTFDREDFLEAMGDIWDVVEDEEGLPLN
jgi:hypothetical protein